MRYEVVIKEIKEKRFIVESQKEAVALTKEYKKGTCKIKKADRVHITSSIKKLPDVDDSIKDEFEKYMTKPQ